MFFFVDELLPDQMPETVHLMPQGKAIPLRYNVSCHLLNVTIRWQPNFTYIPDEIWVEHRLQPTEEVKVEPIVATNNFSAQFKILLEKGSHSDIIFLVGEEAVPVVAHKAILSARYVRTVLCYRFVTLIKTSLYWGANHELFSKIKLMYNTK